MANTATRNATRKELGKIAEPFGVNDSEVSNAWRSRPCVRGQLRFNREIEVNIAESHVEHEGAYLLRWEVFGTELGQLRNYHKPQINGIMMTLPPCLLQLIKGSLMNWRV